MIRVLYIANQAGNRSGTGRYTEKLLQALAQFPDELQLTVQWPQLIPSTLPANVEVVGLKSRFEGGFRGMFPRARTYDLIHYPATIGGLCATPPSVVTVHDLAFLRHPEWFRPDRLLYYRLRVNHGIQKARRVIADSHATANDLVELLHVKLEKIDVVPLGVDETFKPAPPEAIEALRQKLNLPQRFFLFVGTFEPRKNLPRLIEAWTRVRDDAKVDLVLAGRDGWKTAPIHEAINASRHRQHIHRLHYVPESDLPVLYSAAEAFVWPSLFEGFGLPPLEALACGVPVITSNTSSIPEVMRDAALLVDPCNVEALAEAMQTLSADPNCVHRAARGMLRAAEFSWARTARATMDSYVKAASPL